MTEDTDYQIGRLADSLDRLAAIAEKFYAAAYPEKPRARDATVTSLRTREEEELEANLQGTETTLDEWRNLGPREQAFLKAQSKKA